MSKEVERIRSLARMARQEGIAELSGPWGAFKLEAVPAPKETEPEPEEIDPIEGKAREFEADGIPVDRKALAEFLAPQQKRGRS